MFLSAKGFVLEYTFNQAAESYITHGGEAKYLSPIIKHFNNKTLLTIAPFDIRNLADILYPTQTGSTKNRCVLSPARAVMNHGYDRGWCPLIRIRRFKTEKPTPKIPASTIWMFMFMRQCDLDKLPHLASLILFMNQTGARISEAINLKWNEVNLSERKVLLLKTKTERNSVRALTDELVSRMSILPRWDNVFKYTSRYSVNEAIQRVCERAKIVYKSPHLVGRHSFATNAINKGIDIKTAMDAGGWKSVSIFVETYVHTKDAGRIVADQFNGIRFDALI